MQPPNSIRLFDKPVGISSFDVIRWLRRAEGINKAGHAGTLDPAASGLLIVGVGDNGTKQLNQFLTYDKTYNVVVKLGISTDTGDKEGKVIEKVTIDTPLYQEDIEACLEKLKGDVLLPVPRYSAVKVDGEPLYKKARRGDIFEPPKRKMRIHSLILNDVIHENGYVFLDITMTVASGVFVRSVAEAIGKCLGYPAMTASLRRIRIGKFKVEDAEKIENTNEM